MAPADQKAVRLGRKKAKELLHSCKVRSNRGCRSCGESSKRKIHAAANCRASLYRSKRQQFIPPQGVDTSFPDNPETADFDPPDSADSDTPYTPLRRSKRDRPCPKKYVASPGHHPRMVENKKKSYELKKVRSKVRGERCSNYVK